MQREIAYRAWHKQKKIMCDVLLICFVNRYVNVLPEYQLEGGNQEEWRFDEIELMQFTGLTDKHGRKIFEGDLLKDVALGDDVVYTADWKGCLRGNSKMGTRLACDHPRRISSHFKVVGNRFDHPHLLNKTSNQ